MSQHATTTIDIPYNNIDISLVIILKSNKPYGPWGQTPYLQIYTMDQTYTCTWMGEGIVYVYITQNTSYG